MAALSYNGGVIAKGTVTSASERAYLSNQLLVLADGGYKTPSKNPDTRKYLETVQALCTTDVWKIKSGEYLNRRLKSTFFREVALLISDESIPMLSLKCLHYLAIYFNHKSDWKDQFAIIANSLNNSKTEGKYFYEFIKKQIGLLEREPTSPEDWAIFFNMSVKFIFPALLINFSMRYRKRTEVVIDFSKFSSNKLKTINLVLTKKKSFTEPEWEYFEMLLNSLPIVHENRTKFSKLIVDFFRNAFPFLENKIDGDLFFFVMWLQHSTNFRIKIATLRKYSERDKYADFANHFSDFHYLKMRPYIIDSYNRFRSTPFCNLIKFLPLGLLQSIQSIPLEIVVHLAGGGNIRKNPLNIPFTKKMAHLFTDSPNYAYVWIRSLGGDENFCAVLSDILRLEALPSVDDNLVLHFEKYSNFFKKLVLWQEDIIAFSILRERRLNDILRWLMGYIHHLIQDEPDFDLKGRTFDSFIRLVDEYTDLQQMRRTSLFQTYQIWEGADYNGLEIKIESDEFKIVQIKTLSELAKEGQVMSHCVGGYSGSCYIGDVSIWSLRRKVGFNKWKSKVTMEIRKNRKIVQAKATYNSTPEDEHLQIIKDWAKREKLIFVRC